MLMSTEMGVFWYQASPERSTRTQQKEFQSNILDGVMEHLLAADVLLGQHKQLFPRKLWF